MAETSHINSKHTIFSNEMKTTLAFNTTHVKHNV
jgi:hypothetical protein